MSRQDRAEIYDAVMEALRAAPEGLTADQIAEKLNRDRRYVRPRVSEMAAFGSIERQHKRRLNVSGQPAWVWGLA